MFGLMKIQVAVSRQGFGLFEVMCFLWSKETKNFLEKQKSRFCADFSLFYSKPFSKVFYDGIRSQLSVHFPLNDTLLWFIQCITKVKHSFTCFNIVRKDQLLIAHSTVYLFTQMQTNNKKL